MLHNIYLVTDTLFLFNVRCDSQVLSCLLIISMVPQILINTLPAKIAYEKNGMVHAMLEYVVWFLGAPYLRDCVFATNYTKRC